MSLLRTGRVYSIVAMAGPEQGREQPAAAQSDSAAAGERSALYSMGALTKLSAADMRRILQHYELADGGEQYVSHRELSGGLSNSNYRLETSARCLLCKVCDEKPFDALQAQVAALVQLQRHRLPIAYPVSRTDSRPSDPSFPAAAHSYILTLPPWKPIVMYQFLHGTPPSHVTLDVIRQIGAVSSGHHQLTQSATSTTAG